MWDKINCHYICPLSSKWVLGHLLSDANSDPFPSPTHTPDPNPNPIPQPLKHKDSFGKSENLSKIFFAEILVFDHDYEGKSLSSNGLLWISFIFIR